MMPCLLKPSLPPLSVQSGDSLGTVGEASALSVMINPSAPLYYKLYADTRIKTLFFGVEVGNPHHVRTAGLRL